MDSKTFNSLSEAYSAVYSDKVADRLNEENVDEAVYGGTPPEKKDTRLTVTAADKKANTPAYQAYKAGKKKKDGSPMYKVADHMKEGVRDLDPEKGTAERKARLEKKRGMKVDDHPEYKKEEVENVEEGLRDKVGEKVKKHINKYAYKQGIHNNPGWLRKPEKRAALNKAVRDDIKKNPKAAVQYAAGEVKRKVKEKLRREEFDAFDVILEFLIDEEIAQDIQEANWIMANAITEEQIDEILGMFKKKPEKKTEYAGRSIEPVKKDPGYTVDKRRPEVSVSTYGKGGKTHKFKTRGRV